MGGNALKNIETRRVDAQEYHNQLKPDLFSEIRKALPKAKFDDIVAYKQKKDFGDMDILLALENIDGDWRNIIRQHFNPKDVSINTNSKGTLKKETVFSFEYRDFQIDLIPIDPYFYNFAYNYYSYNDLGNLIGKIAKSIGFKFGHKGLQYQLRDPENENNVKNILVSNDFYKSVKFLGFDMERYKKGFNNLEEIFDYVASNPHFSPSVFALENMNHKDRIRDRKRSTYTQFLEKIPEYKDKHPEKPTQEERLQILNEAFKFFDDFEQRYKTGLKEFKNTIIIKNKFNGNLVNKETGLEKQKLGQFMNDYKNTFINKEQFNKFILLSSDEDIKQSIKRHFYKTINKITIGNIKP